MNAIYLMVKCVSVISMVSLLALPNVAAAYTYTIDPTLSNLTLSGTITSTVTETYSDSETGTHYTNTYNLTTAVAPTYGSPSNLITALAGNIDATPGLGTINFEGGTGFSTQSIMSGIFQQRLGSYSITWGVEIGNVYDYFSGAYSSGLGGNILGSSALVGQPENQSFSTIGLSGNWLQPSLIGEGFSFSLGYNGYANGNAYGFQPSSLFIQTPGTGSLLNNGTTESLLTPFNISISRPFATGTITECAYTSCSTYDANSLVSYTLSGQLVAVRTVPLPQTWILMMSGLSLMTWLSNKRKT